MPPAAAAGSEAPGAILPWRCRSDCRAPDSIVEGSSPVIAGSLRATRRRRRPGLLVTVFLRRQPNAENAAAPLGVLHDALRPARGRSCVRPARNAHWSAHGTRRSSRKTLLPLLARCLLQRQRDQVAESSLRAACPGSERTDRTNRSRGQGVAPSFRSGGASRAGEPARPERPPRRRATRARRVRSATARGRR